MFRKKTVSSELLHEEKAVYEAINKLAAHSNKGMVYGRKLFIVICLCINVSISLPKKFVWHSKVPTHSHTGHLLNTQRNL